MLGYNAYAGTLAALMDNPRTSTPLVIAVDAAWGAGKTTLGRLVEKKLGRMRTRGKPHRAVWFNAWLYGDAVDVQSCLASVVARTVSPGGVPPSLLTRKEATSRRWSFLVLGLAFAFVVGFWAFTQGFVVLDLTSFQSGSLAAAGAALGFWGFCAAMLDKLPNLMALVSGDPSMKRNATTMKARRELHDLVRTRMTDGQRVLVVVDDLDRCSPRVAVETLEAVNQLLDAPGLVVLILADMEIVRRQVASHYEGLYGGKTPRGEDFADRFLQKVVGLPFRLPSQDADCMVGLVRAASNRPAVRVPVRVSMRQRLRRWLERMSETRAAQWIESNKTPRAPPTPGQRAFLFLVKPALPVVAELHVIGRFLGLPQVAKGRRPNVGWRFWLSIGALLCVSVAVVWLTPDDPSPWQSLFVVLAYLWLMLQWVTMTTGVAVFLDGWITGLNVRYRLRDYNGGAERLENVDDDKLVELVRADLVRKDAYRGVVDDEQTMRVALAPADQFLPPYPRHAKRVVNRVRFELAIAQERGILSSGKVSPEQVGKWVVLEERWPAFAQQLRTDSVARAGMDGGALAVTDDELARFLRAEPLLGAAIPFLLVQPTVLEVPGQLAS